MRINKRRTIAGAIYDFRRTWGQLLVIGVTMRLTATFLLLLVLAIVVRMFMARHGETRFSDAELVDSFLGFPGIIVVAACCLVWVAITFVEQAALMTLGYATVEGRPVDWVGAMRYVGCKLGVLLSLGFHLLVRVLMVVVPFIIGTQLILQLALGKYHNLFDQQDVYFFLYYRPPGFEWVVGSVVLLLGAMLFLLSFKIVSWLLAIPAVLFENLGPVAAIKDSVDDSKGHRWQLAGLLVLWILAGGLTCVLGTFLIGKFGRSTVSLTSDSAALITFKIGATGFVALVFYALVSFFAMALFAYSAIRVYRHCSGPGELSLEDFESDLGERLGALLVGRNILLGSVGVMVVAGLSAFLLVSKLENSAEQVLIIAHKGESASAPENTLGAVEKAIEERPAFVEADVQVTKDSKVIVFHDSVINLHVKDDGSRVASFYLDGVELRKTGDGRIDREAGEIRVVSKLDKRDPWVTGDSEKMCEKGAWLYINDLTYDELKDIDVGSWWVDKNCWEEVSEGKFDEEFRGATIPTLGQLLSTCRAGDVRVMIELKYDGKFDQPELARLVAETVRKHGMEDEVVVMSFSLERLEEMRNLEPHWTYGQAFNFQPHRSDEVLSGLDFVALHKLGATRRFLVLANRDGIDVYVFTMNDPFGMSAMLSRGVDGMITDDPGLARNMLEVRAGLDPLQRLLVAIGGEVGMFSIFK